MLIQGGKTLRLLPSRRQAEEIALRSAFHFGGLLVDSGDGIGNGTLPCFRGTILQLRAHRPNLRKRLETFVHSLDRAALHFKLFAKIRKRRLDARIHLYRKRLRIALSIDRQRCCVVPRQCPCSKRIFRSVVHDRGNRKFMTERIRRRVMQVPYKSMHSRSRRESLRRAHPVHRDGMLARCFFQRLGLV